MAGSSQNSSKRPHLTNDQRCPRCYKEAEKVLLAAKACQGNIKTVMFNSRLRGSVFNKVYALSVNVLKYRNLLEKIMEETQLLKKENLRKEMTGIMIYELIFGKGLPGESKPVQIIKNYQDDILKIYESLKDKTTTLTGLYSLPKYVRVNTLKTSTSNILKDLEDWNYQQVLYEDSTSFDEYLNLASNLKPGSFLIDYHFKDLLVFASSENLSSWPLYQKGHVFIQDKSSYLPVHALDPKPDSVVVDACAAPGMKTIHIAARMQNSGKIHAFERDKQRCKILENMLKSADIRICTSGCEDFYLVNRDNPKYKSVEYILVDPSCSGSGMVNRMDEVTDTEESKNKLRLQKLAGFQILLLKHALSFPSVKRVVYSTCSITEEENEFVVHEVLNHYRHCFKLAHVMPHWPIRGFDHFEFGTLCLRAFPDKSLTNGFFVAMFERLDFDEQQQFHENSLAYSVNSRKGKSRKRKSEFQEENQQHENQKQNCAESRIKGENIYSENSLPDHDISKTKHKKKKHKSEFQADIPYSEIFTYVEQGYATKENSELFSCKIEDPGTVESSTCDQSHDVKKKHKKKHSRKDRVKLEDLAELKSEPCLLESVSVNVIEKKRKNKHYSDHVEAKQHIEDSEITRIKQKKSKKEKVKDTEVQHVLDEVGHLENKIKHKKVKKSFPLNNEESNEQDIEPCSETVPEIPKKKHKKKCKDKKHKEDWNS